MVSDEEKDMALIDLFDLDPSKIYTFDLETFSTSEDNGPTYIRNKTTNSIKFINKNKVHLLKSGEEILIEMNWNMWVSENF